MPFTYHNTTLKQACEDKHLHLVHTDDGDMKLRLDHDYYFQISGQLAITKAAYYDIVTWTCVDLNIQCSYFFG